MISGVDQRTGPQRANRCSLSESSLVNLSTVRGAGPSIDATTVSSRATSSATHRRPLGSVYRAAKARRSEWSIGSSKVVAYRKSKDWSAITCTACSLLTRDSVRPRLHPHGREVLTGIPLGKADFGLHDVADESVKAGIREVSTHESQPRRDFLHNCLVYANFAGYALSVQIGHGRFFEGLQRMR